MPTECSQRDPASVRLQVIRIGRASRALPQKVAAQIFAVVFGLKPDKVEGDQSAHDLAVFRKRGQDVGWRAGNVQEVTNAVLVPPLAKEPCERHQMIVVNPDDIVRLEYSREVVGEIVVDFLIT